MIRNLGINRTRMKKERLKCLKLVTADLNSNKKVKKREEEATIGDKVFQIIELRDTIRRTNTEKGKTSELVNFIVFILNYI